ncbi:MAG: hypothetical protein KDJ74_16340 [Notoacmeibacter sp.]|nr:hypothetical protein [Notoacmeibacter sp.]
MLTNIPIFAALAVTAALMAWPRVWKSTLWRATVTPLASIIGSGFLILGPILDHAYGKWAPAVMAGLCLAAWLFGWAIRFSMHALDEGHEDGPTERSLEVASSWALAFAYFISVAYYLNLFGAFAVRIWSNDAPEAARIVTSAVLLLVLAVGWTRGFSALERMEQASVSTKLAIIAALLAGLAAFFAGKASQGALVLNEGMTHGWAAVTLAFGLVVTVQGFETSRYLGDRYDAPTRIRSMQLAQVIAAVIYLAYIGMMAYLFPADTVPVKETETIDMTARISSVLPVLLIVAALSAQFSAAIADTGGSGGLVKELTGGRIAHRLTYAALVAAGLAMTWTLDVFAIVAYASRAFALYYALQAALAGLRARASGRPLHAVAFAAMALAGLAITLFGTPVE